MPPHKKPKTEGSSSGPEGWMKLITDTLEHKDNKEFLDAKNIVLATVEGKQPRARYHVHRGFVKDGEKDLPLLLTTTDKLMPKAAQIESSAVGDKAGSPAEYVFWMSPTGDQIRVQGLVHLYTPSSPAEEQSVSTLVPDFDWEAFRLEQWKELSGHLRATFLHKAPGEPVDEEFEDGPEKLDTGAEGEDDALKRFCLVVMEPTKVDWSSQNAEPPFRRVWTKEDDESWSEQKVAV